MYSSNKKSRTSANALLKQNYFFRDGVCANALAAAVFEALLEWGFRKTLDAAEAAFLEVCLLFLAIHITYLSADYTIYCVIKQESVCIL